MSTMTVHRRPTVASRRLGYSIAVGVNALLIYLVNVSPGWPVVPFLTSATAQVLPWVNATMAAGIVANCVYIAWDPLWFKALGDIVTTSVGIVGLVRMWQVFPFDFAGSSIDWVFVARVTLGIGVAGSAIAIIVAVVTLLRTVVTHE